MANRWQWDVVTVDEIWAQFQLLCLVLQRLCRLSLTSTTEAQVLGKSGARSFGDLAGGRDCLCCWIFSQGYSKFKR